MNPLPRIAALAAAALIVAACSGGDASPATTEPGPSTTSTPVTTTTTSPPTTTTTTTTSATTTTTTTVPAIPRQPLTGQPLAEGEAVVDRPALAVKIDNVPAARRNHRGLAVADVVFEEIVEGDVTRFAAVFHSRGSEMVGPIRSGRSQDIQLLTSFLRPLFAWSGGNPGVERLVADSLLTDLNWQRGFRGYYRGPGSEPNNLYNDTDTLWAQTPDDHPGPPPQQFSYVLPGERFSGTPVAGVDLAMRGIDLTWSWDEATGRFLRAQRGRSHEDVLHGPIGATNVVVLVVEYRPSPIDARSPEAQTIGDGPAYVFSNGQVQAGRWQRNRVVDPIGLYLIDGTPIALEPGNTWIELAEAVPSGDEAWPDVAMDIAFR